MEERPPILRVAANILSRKSQTADKGWVSSLGLDEVLTNPHLKKYHVTNFHKESACECCNEPIGFSKMR